MQLLVLKILYLLFTTKGTSEYFYTNDLCVLVDVFLRELVDLDEDSESVRLVNSVTFLLIACKLTYIHQLRHTYLRVLHPLLTKTQLRDIPYKRAQIVVALESLMENSQIRDIDPTTKRLVERCLSGDWCVQYRKSKDVEKQEARGDVEGGRVASPSSDSTTAAMQMVSGPSTSASAHVERTASVKKKGLKISRSVENLKGNSKPPRPPRSALDALRRPNNSSASSLPGGASAAKSPQKWKEMPRSGGLETTSFSTQQTSRHYHHSYNENSLNVHPSPYPVRADSLDATMNGHNGHPPRSPDNISPSSPISVKHESSSGTAHPPRRSAPPTPPKRRKPPAIPVERTNGGATITVTKTTSLQQTM